MRKIKQLMLGMIVMLTFAFQANAQKGVVTHCSPGLYIGTIQYEPGGELYHMYEHICFDVTFPNIVGEDYLMYTTAPVLEPTPDGSTEGYGDGITYTKEEFLELVKESTFSSAVELSIITDYVSSELSYEYLNRDITSVTYDGIKIDLPMEMIGKFKSNSLEGIDMKGVKSKEMLNSVIASSLIVSVKAAGECGDGIGWVCGWWSNVGEPYDGGTGYLVQDQSTICRFLLLPGSTCTKTRTVDAIE